jgi:hypothetical protein
MTGASLRPRDGAKEDEAWEWFKKKVHSKGMDLSSVATVL